MTTTTVGYGDLASRSAEGRVLAALLMLVGIGTLSMITGSIATYFIGARRARNSHIKHIQEQLDRWDEMTPAERRQVVRMLEAAEERRD